MRRIALLAAAVGAFAGLPGTAQAELWAEPAAPLNQTPTAGAPPSSYRNIDGPVIESIGGVLHAAWAEWDGTNDELRVARLEGDRWVALGASCSPINVSPRRNAGSPGLADDGGVPLVVWSEAEADVHGEIQAARFDAAKGEWVRPWGQVSPTVIDDDPPRPKPRSHINSDVAIVGGRPYISYQQVAPIPFFNKLRRLSADGTTFESVPAPASYDSFSLKIETDGTELYAETTETVNQYIDHFSGGAWTRLPRPAEYAWMDGLVVHQGLPYVSSRGTVWRFQAGAWQAVADTPPIEISATSLVFVGDTLHAAGFSAATGRVEVYRLDSAGTFVKIADGPLANTAPAGEGAAPPAVDTAALAGRPWIAWPSWDGAILQGRVAGLFDAAPPAPASDPGAPGVHRV